MKTKNLKMKVIHILSTFSFISLVNFASAQQAQPSADYHLGFRVAPRISTLGAGLEVAKGFTPNFGLRAGFNYFSYGYDATESDVSYKLDLELKSFGLFADWHPFKGAFRLSGGLLINGNGLSGSAKPTTLVEIGGTDYDLTSVNLDISYNTLAPYLGLGWDTTFGDRDNWGFAFDLGLIYSGSAEAALTATGLGLSDATFEENRIKEQNELQSDLDSLKWWPVISAGLVYQF
jgi:hypothetical protein